MVTCNRHIILGMVVCRFGSHWQLKHSIVYICGCDFMGVNTNSSFVTTVTVCRTVWQQSHPPPSIPFSTLIVRVSPALILNTETGCKMYGAKSSSVNVLEIQCWGGKNKNNFFFNNLFLSFFFFLQHLLRHSSHPYTRV